MQRILLLSVVSVVTLMLWGGVTRAEQVENPAYKSWAKYKPGTSTTLSMQTTVAGQNTKSEMKTTLDEVTDDKVTVEIATSMEMNGQKMDMPAQKISINKMVDTNPAPGQPKPIDPDTLAKASEEDVTVPAGTFKAKVIETQTSANGMNIKNKVWFSDDVPGGTVKVETTGDGAAAMTAKGELTAVDKK